MILGPKRAGWVFQPLAMRFRAKLFPRCVAAFSPRRLACKLVDVARETFAFLRYDTQQTDPKVQGDHVEEKDGKLVLVDEDGKEVYSAPASAGRFIRL
jgi:hypothetical protein